MNILVTGGAGYIGSHTVQNLIRNGLSVVVLDNLSTGFRQSVPKDVKFVELDVRDTQQLTQVLNDYEISAVVHFAASLIVPESVEKPLDYYDNNVKGVLSLLHACLVSRVRKIVFSSTAAVYGEPTSTELIKESTPPRPINPYGQSKRMSELILEDAFKAYGISSVILRYFNVAGAALDGSNGQRSKKATHLIKVCTEAACHKRASMSIFGVDYPTIDGTGVRDYIHVEDLAEAHRLALNFLETDNDGCHIFNCGYGKGASVREVIQAVKRVSQKDFTAQEVARRPGDPAQLVADSTQIREKFGWKPRYDDLDVICRSAYQWESSL